MALWRKHAPSSDGTDRKTIALLPWGNVIEDFRDDHGLTLDQCREWTGAGSSDM